jgi:hypothetical protein
MARDRMPARARRDLPANWCAAHAKRTWRGPSSPGFHLKLRLQPDVAAHPHAMRDCQQYGSPMKCGRVQRIGPVGCEPRTLSVAHAIADALLAGRDVVDRLPRPWAIAALPLWKRIAASASDYRLTASSSMTCKNHQSCLRVRTIKVCLRHRNETLPRVNCRQPPVRSVATRPRRRGDRINVVGGRRKSPLFFRNAK